MKILCCLFGITLLLLIPFSAAAEQSQKVVIKEKGISFSLPADWKEEGEPLNSANSWAQRWLGPDNTKLFVFISDYRPNYRQNSIAEEAQLTYEEKKRSDARDLRFLELNRVKGVYYRTGLEFGGVHYEMMHWDAQYLSHNQRRIIEVSLSCQSSDLPKYQEVYLAILNSLKFAG